MVLATVASVVFDLESHGVAVVGEVPSGLPVPGLPEVTFEDVKMLLFAGLGITIVGYSDIMLIARGFPLAPAEGETAADLRPDPQAELVAMVGVHAMVGIFSGYPVSASGSRTALAIAGGARSQIYSLVAGLCIVAVLFFAGPLMAPLPWAALGAVVFYAASKLVSIPEFRRLWRFRRREFVLAVITLVGTVVIGILQGVVLAIALSLLEMLYRLARPHEGVLGRVPGVAGMHDVADYPDAQTIPGCIFYRYDAPLFFANIGDLRERVDKLLDIENEAYPDDPVRWFVLNVEANVEIDITAADGLRELTRELADRGIHLGLARVKNDVYEPLDRAGVIDVIGKEMLFATLPVAEESYLRWALAHEPAAPTETPQEAIEDEPTDSALPWQLPDSDDQPAEGRETQTPAPNHRPPCASPSQTSRRLVTWQAASAPTTALADGLAPNVDLAPHSHGPSPETVITFGPAVTVQLTEHQATGTTLTRTRRGHSGQLRCASLPLDSTDPALRPA